MLTTKKKTSKALELWLRLRDLNITGMNGEHVVHEAEDGTLTVTRRHSKITVEVVGERQDES